MTDDLISRQALTAEIMRRGIYPQGVRHAIENAPAVNMTQWTDADKQLPNTDELVLVIVNGKPHKNIELIDAYEFATYSSTEGWIVEAYPLWEKAHVSYWMPLPEPPREDEHETD